MTDTNSTYTTHAWHARQEKEMSDFDKNVKDVDGMLLLQKKKIQKKSTTKSDTDSL